MLYFQPLHIYREMMWHPQGLFVKELQVLIATKWTVGGFTLEVLTHVTV